MTFTDAQWAQLQATFPTGVCDYSKPGVDQQPPKARWLTFADGPGGRPLGQRAGRRRVRARHGRRHGPGDAVASLGAPASFGAFTPGVTRDYTATTTATVISTAGDALLRSPTRAPAPATWSTARSSCPQPLQARARNAANTGTAYNNVGSLALTC